MKRTIDFGEIFSLLLINIGVLWIIHTILVQTNLFVKPDCEYRLPTNYRLMYNKYTKEYAVRDGNYRFSRHSFAAAEDDENTFKDSCKAKEFIKEYIQERAFEAK